MRIFISDCTGVAATEFALFLPVLMLFFMGSVEVTRYEIAAQKLEKAAFTTSDIVAQQDIISNAELTDLFLAAGQIMQPFAFSSNGVVVVSSVQKQGNNTPRVAWQRRGGGNALTASKIGAEGSTATLPTGFTMNADENVIIAEVYYSYSSLFQNQWLPAAEMYKVAVYRPRLGALTSPPA